MSVRTFRLLALHGKGTSARIMKTQIKPIVDALGELVEVEYLDGGEPCAPYQGIESIFPNQPYFSWYEQPTCAALQAAHSRVAARLATGDTLRLKQEGTGAMNAAKTEAGVGLLAQSPASAYLAMPEADMASELAWESMLFQQQTDIGCCISSRPWGTQGRYRGEGALQPLMTSSDSTDSDPSTAGPMTPRDEPLSRYDGVICFSQGCAVTTGLLMELTAQLGAKAKLPVRLAVLICGGRPFERRGSMERVETRSAEPIGMKSVHVHGRLDAGLAESKQLAQLYHDAGKQVVELDIGHCPPRRTSDVKVVVDAIRRALVTLDS